MNVKSLVHAAVVSRFTAKYLYPLNTRFSGDDLVFLSMGYEEEPPMDVPLEASDEPDRYFIQLYHRTATQVDFTGKRVLEASCGHGGGASYLVRTLGPASYTGLDLNAAGIEFCRKRHQLPGLDFVQGDAVKLPFPDQSFDVVIHVEAAEHYRTFPDFLNEVARVLTPEGHFVYADLRARDQIAKWERELSNAPLRLLSERDISEDVARGVEKGAPRLKEMSFRYFPTFLVETTFANFARDLRSGDLSYRMFSFANE
jgi:ubiquinone/menaquinone biosynthesis C-methylase UbiE